MEYRVWIESLPFSSKTERAGETDGEVVKSQDAQNIQELAVMFADSVPENI